MDISHTVALSPTTSLDALLEMEVHEVPQCISRMTAEERQAMLVIVHGRSLVALSTSPFSVSDGITTIDDDGFVKKLGGENVAERMNAIAGLLKQ